MGFREIWWRFYGGGKGAPNTLWKVKGQFRWKYCYFILLVTCVGSSFIVLLNLVATKRRNCRLSAIDYLRWLPVFHTEYRSSPVCRTQKIVRNRGKLNRERNAFPNWINKRVFANHITPPSRKRYERKEANLDRDDWLGFFFDGFGYPTATDYLLDISLFPEWLYRGIPKPFRRDYALLKSSSEDGKFLIRKLINRPRKIGFRKCNEMITRLWTYLEMEEFPFSNGIFELQNDFIECKVMY